MSALTTTAERFALDQPVLQDGSESVAPVPFGQQFAVDDAIPQEVGGDRWQWCPRRQIAVASDGTPSYRSMTGMVMSTTGPSSDGGPSTGGEEWRPDYQADADAGLL